MCEPTLLDKSVIGQHRHIRVIFLLVGSNISFMHENPECDLCWLFPATYASDLRSLLKALFWNIMLFAQSHVVVIADHVPQVICRRCMMQKIVVAMPVVCSEDSRFGFFKCMYLVSIVGIFHYKFYGCMHNLRGLLFLVDTK
jgi:hypothetical protein